MRSRLKTGFTLLEMLVALAIVAMAMTIVWQTFTVAIKAWRKGENFLAEMHHGDFVMEQLVESLRSAAYFDGSGEIYGFRLENRSEGRYPNDKLSWVKSGKGFMPKEALLGQGLHRIDLTVDANEDGDPAVMARIYPHLAKEDEDEFYAGDTWEISQMVKGIDCRVYVEEDEDWLEEWEDTNSIPALIELTLFMDPLEGEDEPVKITRAVQIPISRELKSGVIFDEAGKETTAAGSGAPTDPTGGADPRARRPGGAGSDPRSRRPAAPGSNTDPRVGGGRAPSAPRGRVDMPRTPGRPQGGR